MKNFFLEIKQLHQEFFREFMKMSFFQKLLMVIIMVGTLMVMFGITFCIAAEINPREEIVTVVTTYVANL